MGVRYPDGRRYFVGENNRHPAIYDDTLEIWTTRRDNSGSSVTGLIAIFGINSIGCQSDAADERA